MSPAPREIDVYHITHVDNLAAILDSGSLLSDADMKRRGGPASSIGMSSIKQRRLALPVHCHQGDRVGEYVPFYFCPRSIMLFVIHCANHAELAYRGGQEPIVHLEVDLRAVVRWADDCGRRWAFSLSNAGASYAEFRSKLEGLDELDWDAIRSNDFREPDVKEGKQAEFLVKDSLPWTFVRRIGVCSSATKAAVQRVLERAGASTLVEVRRDWYY